MNANELEELVWQVEGVRVVLRVSSGHAVHAFEKKNAADETWTVNEWIEKRIRPLIADNECVVVAGDGEEPHGKMLLRTLRQSYG